MQLGLAAKAGAIFLLLDEALLEFGFAGSSQRGASLPRVGAATAVLCSAEAEPVTARSRNRPPARAAETQRAREATSGQDVERTVAETTPTTPAPAPTPAVAEGRAMESPAGRAISFERGRSTAAAGAAVVAGGERQRLPSVTLKLAMDRNGAVDDMSEGPKRFTSQESLDAVHRIRRDCGAVLVGVGTVVRDDPSLTVRRVPLNEGQTQQPTRVVLDRTLRLTAGQPSGSAGRAVLRDGHASVIFYSSGCDDTEERAGRLRASVKRPGAAVSEPPEATVGSSRTSPPAVDFIGLPPRKPGGGVDLTAVLGALFERGIEHVLVEGGPSVARGFLLEGLVDRAIIVRAPMEFSRPVPSEISSDTLRRAGLELVGCTRWGDDEVECWTRAGLGWPGGRIGGWP